MSYCQRSVYRRMLPLLAGVALLSALLWAPRAGAAILTTSQTLSAQASTATTRTLTFDNFDASLGALLSVEIELFANASGQGFATVSCPSTATFPCVNGTNLSITETIQAFTRGSISLFDTKSDSISIVCRTGPDSSRVCQGGVSASVYATDLATDAATLDLFDDPGSFVQTFLMSSIGLNAVPAAQSVSGTVTYTYDDSPPANVSEPGTLASVSLALLGLAGATRRRRG